MNGLHLTVTAQARAGAARGLVRRQQDRSITSSHRNTTRLTDDLPRRTAQRGWRPVPARIGAVRPGDPGKMLARGDTWVVGPEASYEREDDVGNVVFPCGFTVAPDGDTLNSYYGAADTCTALATASIREMLRWLHRYGKPSDISLG